MRRKKNGHFKRHFEGVEENKEFQESYNQEFPEAWGRDSAKA